MARLSRCLTSEIRPEKRALTEAQSNTEMRVNETGAIFVDGAVHLLIYRPDINVDPGIAEIAPVHRLIEARKLGIEDPIKLDNDRRSWGRENRPRRCPTLQIRQEGNQIVLVLNSLS